METKPTNDVDVPPAEAPPPTPRPQATSCELAALSKAHMRELFELAYSVAMVVTKSKERSDDLTQSTFDRLMTTRRWDGTKPLEAHVVGIVRSLASNQHKGAKSERSASAQAGFYREVVGEQKASPEDMMLDHAADEAGQQRATREVEQLAAKVAAHPLAARVLQMRVDGSTRAADIARALGASVDDVYRANDVLRRNLRAIRKNRHETSDHDEDEEA